MSGFLFVVGNATWRLANEPKLFWFPLGIFIAVLVIYAAKDQPKNKRNATFVEKTLLGYFVTLAWGNIIKQAFYTEGLQINDYIWGLVVTLVMIITIIAWAIRKRRFGKK